MPRYTFYQVLDGRHLKLANADLESREAARDFGIDLAQNILRAQSPEQGPATSRIVIYDAHGEDLDTIVSEAF